MNSLGQKSWRVLETLFVVLVLWPGHFTLGARADPELTSVEISEAKYLGAASCASSLCHGSVQQFEQSPILQNEFIIWQSDRYRNMHAKAFNKLHTSAARSIAEKLTLGPASEAPECLTCHAELVPVERQGERFQLSDGISCESCHGAAEHYIDLHTEPDQPTEKLISYGLYPTWKTQARARLCLSCHLGGGDRIINHRIMGAGHPRLSFEMDTFTHLQPHHVVDQDYIKRKGQVDFISDWAVAQGIAAGQALAWLMDRKIGWHGIFVEPTLLDCHSCHQRMDAGRWQARGGTGLGPGEMRLNDASLVMLRLILMAVQPDLATQLRDGTRALHQATTIGFEEVLQAASQLKSDVETAVNALAKHRFTIVDLVNILGSLEREAKAGELADYVVAEQAAMAMVNLVLAFERAGILEKEFLRNDIDQLFEVVADDYEYRDEQLVAAIRMLLKRLPD